MTSFADIRLRALEPEDLEIVYRIENDSRFWRFGTTTVPFSRYVLRRYLESASYDLYADQQVRFVIEGTDEEQRTHALGLADLTNFSPQHGRAEIALAILPEYQGKHCGPHAVLALMEYARGQHLHQLYAIIATTNLSAGRIFQHLGFEKTAVLKEWLKGDEGYTDAAVWQQTL